MIVGPESLTVTFSSLHKNNEMKNDNNLDLYTKSCKNKSQECLKNNKDMKDGFGSNGDKVQMSGGTELLSF